MPAMQLGMFMSELASFVDTSSGCADVTLCKALKSMTASGSESMDDLAPQTVVRWHSLYVYKKLDVAAVVEML